MSTIARAWQRPLDIYIFLNVAGYFGWQTWKTVAEGRLDFIEGVFIVHNIILCLCFLVRSPAGAIQTKLSHQAVALCAFYSGALFIGPPLTESPILLKLSWGLTLLALCIGTVSLWQLGKSFGVLIAVRELRTGGLYSFVRHPMYLSDIVFRVAYLCGHPSGVICALFLASTACYALRARLEENFWAANTPAYADYMQRVRYRFIPGLF